MFNRYKLDVSYHGNRIFKGEFMSINKAIKTAFFFDNECHFYMYDYLSEKAIPDTFVKNMIEEFKYGEIYI